MVADTLTHLNHLIENQLRLCHCDHGAIELVISEIKLSSLLDRVYQKLVYDAASKNIKLPITSARLPTLLVDTKWMEHLLVNLVANAINYSPKGSEIRIGINADTEYCALEIENKMPESLSSSELKVMLKNFRSDDICGNEKK